METNKSKVKSIIKILRGWSIINVPVRFLIKKKTKFNQKLFNFFSLHWPVYGTIKFYLPGNETVKIFSRGDDFVSTQSYWKGYMGYEGPSVNLFYHLSKKAAVIFDIGANVGYFTLIAAASNGIAQIYSFEPIKFIFDRLERNKSINQFKNIISINSIVGDSDEPTLFYAPVIKGISHAGSTKKGWTNNAVEIKVNSVMVDTFKRENLIPKIDLIKIDCEFHEVEVLRGMLGILQEDKPIIIMEILFPEGHGQKGHFENNQYLEIEEIMKKFRYYFYLISESGLIRTDVLEYNPEHRNYLFSPKCSKQTYLSYSEMAILINQIS